MKPSLRFLLSTLSAGALWPLVAAEPAPADAPKERKEIRVITSTAGERGPGSGGPAGPNGPVSRPNVRLFAPAEMESVTYLGVETSPTSPTLVAQLSLPEGSGLVVNQVIPQSPAAGVLKPHDILLKFDDQILIEQRQLAVLVRNRQAGDEATLTYLRAGKQATAKVKLAKHDAPKLSAVFESAGPAAARERMLSAGGFDLQASPPDGVHNRDEVNRVLSMIDAAGGTGPRRVEIFGAGPGDRNVSVTVNTRNSRIRSDDEGGSLELTINQGKKELVAKNAKGEQIFAGPVNTPEERKALPDDVRARLEKLEDMKQFSFKTDGDFQGAETKVLRPRGQGISIPREKVPANANPARATLFF